MESSQWPNTGIFAGMTSSLGNWQECLLVSKYDVTGKYCLVELHYDLNQQRAQNTSSLWPDEGASVWDVIESVRKCFWRVRELRPPSSWLIFVYFAVQAKTVVNKQTAFELGLVHSRVLQSEGYREFLELYFVSDFQGTRSKHRRGR